MVICAGTAGGLSDDLKIGDVVVATETVEHDFRWGILKTVDRCLSFPGDRKSIAVLENEVPDHGRVIRRALRNCRQRRRGHR